MSAPSSNENVYERIGVRPIINCCSVRTVHGGSLMLPQVKRAMESASRQFVHLEDLMPAVGRHIAEVMGAPAALVTCGSAAALTMGTAACVAGNDPEKIYRLPDTRGMRNKVIAPSNQRFGYDLAVRMVGVTIVEVDSMEAYLRELDDTTAMVLLLGKMDAKGPLHLKDMIGPARERGVPIMVDAASEHPRKPDPYLSQGADLVIYSGGKYLRGPQPSGLLLGDPGLVESAWRNSSPHNAIGRPMKVGKEEMMGLVAAVDYWFTERDEAAEDARWRRDVETIVAEVNKVPGVKARLREPAGVDRVPVAHVAWDGVAVPITALALRAKLLEGDPRVMLDDLEATEYSLKVDPFGLEPGQARIVAEAMRAVLATAVAGRDRPAQPAADGARMVAGLWDVEVLFAHGVARHTLDLTQQGGTLSGTHATQFHAIGLTGRVDGDAVDVTSVGRYEGTSLSYRFSGRVVGTDAMEGTLQLGTQSPITPGPVLAQEYGQAAWRAVRQGAAAD